MCHLSASERGSGTSWVVTLPRDVQPSCATLGNSNSRLAQLAAFRDGLIGFGQRIKMTCRLRERVPTRRTVFLETSDNRHIVCLFFLIHVKKYIYSCLLTASFKYKRRYYINICTYQWLSLSLRHLKGLVSSGLLLPNPMYEECGKNRAVGSFGDLGKIITFSWIKKGYISCYEFTTIIFIKSFQEIKN